MCKRKNFVLAGILSAMLIASFPCTACGQGKYYNIQPENESILFIGDSRTVGLMQANTDRAGAGYICEVGIGYDWLVSKSGSLAPALPGTLLVVNLGVNDTGNCQKYIQFLNRKAPEWVALGYRPCFMTVNPVTGACHSVAQGSVDAFNAQVLSSLSPEWSIMDTCSVLKAGGFGTRDGLHYDRDTYRKIYDMALSFAFPVQDNDPGMAASAYVRSNITDAHDEGRGCVMSLYPCRINERKHK